VHTGSGDRSSQRGPAERPGGVWSALPPKAWYTTRTLSAADEDERIYQALYRSLFKQHTSCRLIGPPYIQSLWPPPTPRFKKIFKFLHIWRHTIAEVEWALHHPSVVGMGGRGAATVQQHANGERWKGGMGMRAQATIARSAIEACRNLWLFLIHYHENPVVGVSLIMLLIKVVFKLLITLYVRIVANCSTTIMKKRCLYITAILHQTKTTVIGWSIYGICHRLSFLVLLLSN